MDNNVKKNDIKDFENSGNMNMNVAEEINSRDTLRDYNSVYNGDVTNNYYYPKLKTNKDSQDKANGSLRPYLADRYNEKVKVIGLCICQYRKHRNRYTVINVMDYSGHYVADHIQIDIPNGPDGCPIVKIDTLLTKQVVIIGKVSTYPSNSKPKGIDYKIDIENIYPVDSTCICDEDPETYLCCLEDVRDKVSMKTPNEVYSMIEIFRRKLNKITSCFGQDYLFNYIVNQYMLNTCNIDLYESGLSISKLNDNVLVDILMLVASTLNSVWAKGRETDLYAIMKKISDEVSILQGVWTYDDINLEEFCNSRLGLGARKAKSLANEVYNRGVDFGEIDKHTTMNTLCAEALRIINTEIKLKGM